MFAKIPGLDQHLVVEPKKTTDPPRFRPPKLICGTVRLYDQEEASEAAFRYACVCDSVVAYLKRRSSRFSNMLGYFSI